MFDRLLFWTGRIFEKLVGSYCNRYCFVFSFCFSIKIEFALATYALGGFPDVTFNAAVDLVIFGKSLYLSLAFDLKDPVGSIQLGADRSTSWYKDKMNKENPTDTTQNYYDNANPNVDFQLSGKLKTNAKR